MSSFVITEKSLLNLSLTLSFLLHAIFLYFIFTLRPLPPEEYIIPVSITFDSQPPALEIKSPVKQIVSDPDIEENTKEPADASYLSSKNVRVDRESIKRSNGEEKRKAAPEKSTPSLKRSSTNKEASHNLPSPRIEKVKKGESELSLKLPLGTGLASSKRDPAQDTSSPVESGSQGIQDYLPNLPDGEITLLNTKASQYAVFVRRVAERVFGILKKDIQSGISSGEIAAAGKGALIKGIMNLDGTLEKVTIEERSGSTQFDEIVRKSVYFGLRDPNPPESAALNDKKIHFIFQSNVRITKGVNPQTRAVVERRYLILSTGLL